MVAYFCQPHIHLIAMSKIFLKNVTYSGIIRQVENFRVIHLGILTGQNCLLVPISTQKSIIIIIIKIIIIYLILIQGKYKCLCQWSYIIM